MPGIDQMRFVGSRYGSEFEDPSYMRNPYRLAEAEANERLRNSRLRNDLLEQDDPEQRRIDAIQAQQDADYDLEYRAPNRIDMMGKNAVRGQGWANRQQEAAAEGYFDPARSAQREHEEEYKTGLAERQYGYGARSRMYAADRGYDRSVDTAGINAGARRDAARIGQGGRVRGQITDEAGNPTPGNEGRVASIDQSLGIGGGKPFPASRFSDFAARYFGGDEAAAEEAIAAEGYYLDPDR